MSSLMSFIKYGNKTLEERKVLSQPDYSGMRIWTNPLLSKPHNQVDEDLSVSVKRVKMAELEKLLKSHDYFYMYSNGRAYDKGKESEEEIEELVGEIGKDGLKLYRKYLKKNESINSENKDKMDIHISVSGKSLDKFFEGMSPSDKASVKTLMTELEVLLKKHNWMNKKEEQEIREIVVEIHELGSPIGFELYKKYADKAGVKIRYFRESVDKRKPILTDYEKFVEKKLKQWKIKSSKELVGEPHKRFWDEVDNEYKCKNKSIEECLRDVLVKHQHE
jgi:hypothetical protein